MKIETLHQMFLKHASVSTDSRNVKENDIFFALKGDNFNGNRYAKDALEKGAQYAIVDEKEYALDPKCILVDNALATLQQLANYHRHHCKAKVVALTGSNGKTTTKELIYAVLKKKYRAIATAGNFNNHIGVPLTLLRIERDTEMAVVEMGANHQGEIAHLCTIAEPDFGYITNFGKAHLEGFGGVEGVIKGKSELYDYLIANRKKVFMNADDPIQAEKLKTYIEKFGYSTQDSTYYIIRLVSSEPFITLSAEGQTLKTQLIGTYNFGNCCAAIIMGKYFNVPLADIGKALAHYVPNNNRSQLIAKKGYRIVLDAYNANPTSMKAALQDFATGNKDHKFLFLGDMLELGEYAHKEHQAMANLAQDLGFRHVYLIGKHFGQVRTAYPQFNAYKDLEAAFSAIALPENAQLLIKGSRGMALERILELV